MISTRNETNEELTTIGGRMAETLIHRGPDSQGIWCDAASGVVLAHRRLAILDISPAGNQPMVSEHGTYVVSFNGEIFNARELQRELELTCNVSRWRGHSDTEILLAGMEAWGVHDTVVRCSGQFALGVWDTERHVLHLVRDRMGEKPLYYGAIDGKFVFASELKAIRAGMPGWRPELNRTACLLYLRYSYVPSPLAIYSGVFKLPPATILEVEMEDVSEGHLRQAEPYWDPASADSKPRENDYNEDELVTETERRIREAVAARTWSDVPLGAFLSGGIDSTVVTALMQENSSIPVKTFTLGFDVKGYDEAPYAKAIAESLHVDATEVYVTSRMAEDVIPELPTIYDEPFADSSQIPTVLVSRIARQGLTVALTGDGGDELFGGYNRYSQGRQLWMSQLRYPMLLRRAAAGFIQAIPAGVLDAAGEVVQALARPGSSHVTLIGDKAHKLARLLTANSLGEVYQRLISSMHSAEMAGIIGDLPTTERYPSDGHASAVRQMMLWDTMNYLPDDILCKVDRASMSCSLETRAPFVDHRLYEYARSLPDSALVRGAHGKWVLRQIAYRHVPRALLDRPKSGFALPIGEWLREQPLRDWAENLLDPKTIGETGLFDVQLVQHLWREHLSRRHNWQYDLWTVLMFEAWRRKWME
jgi:asparagine synthase (glutamine-hydrolysing)